MFCTTYKYNKLKAFVQKGHNYISLSGLTFIKLFNLTSLKYTTVDIIAHGYLLVISDSVLVNHHEYMELFCGLGS